MTILAGSAGGKTPRSSGRLIGSTTGEIDPPDHDLSVGGTEGQPGLHPGFSQFPVEGLKVRIPVPLKAD
jgi:hypothetical protein